jgi:FAD/FMN-containing dehydrogenase
MRGVPKMIFMASYESDSVSTVKEQLDDLQADIKTHHYRLITEQADTEMKAERFWLMRRKSFALLRKNVKNKHTAPFIDDLVVPPETLPEFWPRIKEILEKYEFLYTIAGHLGDGNFHIIPLMDLTDPKERAKIEPALKEVIDLVQEFGGVISGEHNDGLIRSPFLKKMYGKEIFDLFKEAKQIMDPLNIFNPHKKTDADWKWSKRHIRDHF